MSRLSAGGAGDSAFGTGGPPSARPGIPGETCRGEQIWRCTGAAVSRSRRTWVSRTLSGPRCRARPAGGLGRHRPHTARSQVLLSLHLLAYQLLHVLRTGMEAVTW